VPQKILDTILEFDNGKLITFIGLMILYSIIYKLAVRSAEKSQLHTDQRRRFINNSRGIFLLVIFISVLITWKNEIYTVIISVAALAAGIAIASKELILCLMGSFYKASTRPFSVGDRIVVNDIRGDVIEIGLLSTMVLEVGPGELTHQYTGRAITIPNSLFLSHKIINETYSEDYVLHVFVVPVAIKNQWQIHQETLLAAAKESCNQYVARATKHFQALAKRRHVDSPNIEPRVTIKAHDKDVINMIVRVTIPVQKRGIIEQEILKNYYSKTCDL
jgi:small-conductance mechanosensitive channel